MQGWGTIDLLPPISYRIILHPWIYYTLQLCFMSEENEVLLWECTNGRFFLWGGFHLLVFLYLVREVEGLLPCSQPSCTGHSYGCTYSTSAFPCLCQENPNFFIIHQMGSQDCDVGDFHFLGYPYFSVSCRTCQWIVWEMASTKQWDCFWYHRLVILLILW